MGRSLLILAVLGVMVLLTRPRRHETGDHICGWLWLAAGLALQAAWVRLLSREAALPVLHWLPALALLPALRFLWLNRSYHGLWVLAAGVTLNLLVMVSNGGLMPISPGSLRAIGSARGHIGGALALSKDRLLSDGTASLAFLDDRITFAVAGLHVACSVGDLLVAIGCLVTLGEEIWRCARVLQGPSRMGVQVNVGTPKASPR